MKFVKIFLFSVCLMLVMLPAYSASAGLVSCGKDGQEACTICDLAVGIQDIVKFVTKLVGIVCVVIIVVAGIIYIVSAGNPSMITMAKTAIKNAVIGVAVTLIAFVLINFVLVSISAKETPNESVSGIGTNAWTLNITCISSPKL